MFILKFIRKLKNKHDLLLGFIIFLVTIPIIYITNYVILNLYWLWPLFIYICMSTFILIIIVISLYITYLIYNTCKGKGLSYFLSFILALWSIIPLGIKIAILIRLSLLIFNISDIALEYCLNTNLPPSHGDFANILNHTPTGTVGTSTSTNGPGGNPPPLGGGTNIHTSDNPANATLNDPSLANVKAKLELQRSETIGRDRISLYSRTAYSNNATLDAGDRRDLGLVVRRDENNGTSGIYSTWNRRNPDGSTEIRVVRNPNRLTVRGSMADVACTNEFMKYLSKFT